MWQPFAECCATLRAPGLWVSLTGDLQGQKPINCGPLRHLQIPIMLVQMIVAVSADEQS